MVEFLHVRRSEKQNRSGFCLAMLLMDTVWKYWNILLQRLDIILKSLCISSYFDTENNTWRLDIVQKLSCMIFGRKMC